MSRTAFTVEAFGYYLLALGLGLAFVPNLLLALFGLPQTPEVWIRVLGVVVFNIGIYYAAAARSEAVPFFRASTYTRPLVLVCFVGFVLLGLASPVLILFGLVDLAGAVWTAVALRSEQRAGQRVYPTTRIDPRADSRM